MVSNLEHWEAQQEAKRVAARKEGPLTFLAGGGAATMNREHEERRVSDELSREALRRKEAFEAGIKALREANFPDEIAYFRDILLKLNLTSAEYQMLQKVLWELSG
jgi:hypothetical protein